jgi:hypothetical protein
MAYANVAIAPPSPRSRLVLDESLIQEIVDTVQQSLDYYLRNGRQSVTPSAPLALQEPLSTPLPPKELLSPCSPAIEPPADKSNSYGIDCSPVDEPPSVQADVTIQPVQPVQPQLPPPCRLYVQTTTYLPAYRIHIYGAIGTPCLLVLS